MFALGCLVIGLKYAEFFLLCEGVEPNTTVQYVRVLNRM